ncbi:MAG: CpsD/CapB family tyrosine-protein kinase [Clostridiales bacterium]|nr:CpsD/CapB family tyrosine-protein kinase [Clostridiales bacterium]
MANIVDKYRNTRSSVREAIKTVRANIQFAAMDKKIQTLVVTSPSASTGKSTIVAFLGVAFAEAGKSVLLVEADYRRPNLANIFRQRPGNGLLQVLSGDYSLEDAIAETKQEGLYILDTGGKVLSPAELVQSKRFEKFVETARKLFDVIIFDTPPMGAFIEPAVLASQADATMLVLQPGRVQVSVAEATMEQLKKANARVIGCVMNNCADVGSEHYYYYYRYYSQSQAENRKEIQIERPRPVGVERD